MVRPKRTFDALVSFSMNFTESTFTESEPDTSDARPHGFMMQSAANLAAQGDEESDAEPNTRTHGLALESADNVAARDEEEEKEGSVTPKSAVKGTHDGSGTEPNKDVEAENIASGSQTKKGKNKAAAPKDTSQDNNGLNTGNVPQTGEEVLYPSETELGSIDLHINAVLGRSPRRRRATRATQPTFASLPSTVHQNFPTSSRLPSTVHQSFPDVAASLTVRYRSPVSPPTQRETRSTTEKRRAEKRKRSFEEYEADSDTDEDAPRPQKLRKTRATINRRAVNINTDITFATRQEPPQLTLRQELNRLNLAIAEIRIISNQLQAELFGGEPLPSAAEVGSETEPDDYELKRRADVAVETYNGSDTEPNLRELNKRTKEAREKRKQDALKPKPKVEPYPGNGSDTEPDNETVSSRAKVARSTHSGSDTEPNMRELRKRGYSVAPRARAGSVAPRPLTQEELIARAKKAKKPDPDAEADVEKKPDAE